MCDSAFNGWCPGQISSPGPAQDLGKLSEPEFIAFYLSRELGIWAENFLNSSHIWPFLIFAFLANRFKSFFPARKERQLFADWCKLSRASFGRLLFLSPFFGHFDFSDIVCCSRYNFIWKNYRLQKNAACYHNAMRLLF